METLNATKPRRPRRSKADIEAAIQKSAITQIKKKGFAGALVTDIVKRAKIEPIVFYNRFKNLHDFYDEFVKQYDYWISDVLRSHKNSTAIAKKEKLAESMRQLFNALSSDELITELLRWEIAEGTNITERTAKFREFEFARFISELNEEHPDNEIDIAAICTLIAGGIFYMVLHKDRSTFGGIDINTPHGHKRIEKSLTYLGDLLQSAFAEQERRAKLRECLTRNGMSPDAIERCIKEVYN